MSDLNIDCNGYTISLLQPSKYQITFERFPNTFFFCNEVIMPDLDYGTAMAATRTHDLKLPGDKIEFSSLTAKILVDAKLFTYETMSNWLRSMSNLGIDEGTPERTDIAFVNVGGRTFQFNDIYPVRIGSFVLASDLQEAPAITFTAVFNFTTFDFR